MKTKIITIFILLFSSLWGVVEINAQTWNIGYPDSSKVTAILTGNKLTIKGKGEMKNYSFQKIWKDSVKSVFISEGITNIGHHTFRDCRKLESISISEGVKTIGEFAFNNCTKLKNVIIPNSVTEIKKGAFQRCSSLKSIVIPNNVNQIEEYAFYECFNLNKVILGNSLSRIGGSAFRACHNLSSLPTPENPVKIGDIAFRLCDKLETIQVENKHLKYSSIQGVLYTNKQDTLIAYPTDSTGKYKNSKKASDIWNDAFSNYKINSLHFPQTLQV